MITTIVRKHLAEKLRPASVLYVTSLGGCSGTFQYSKTRGDQPKKSSAKPTNLVKPSIKREFDPKGKYKLFSEEPIVDNNDEEELDEAELKRRKAHEAELDENQRILREAEGKEKAVRESRSALESRKLLFLVWTLQIIQIQPVDSPNQYWLESVVSFDLQNTQDSQLDLPITSKAFMFCSFIKVANVPVSDNGTNKLYF
ncbi:unnamed protein product [Lactuca saligna]|uniref:Uncharacterized protein n=1 Tax=Lactuca saligna TaxID=75948 RepID=A0AA36A2M1_LACSI|nr:unnamed protein product [Lactuca saligna]